MDDLQRIVTEQGHTINRLTNEVAALHTALEVNKRRLEECANNWMKEAADLNTRLNDALALARARTEERDAWKVQALNHANPE